MDKAKRYYGLFFADGLSTFEGVSELDTGFISFDTACKLAKDMTGTELQLEHNGKPCGVVSKAFFNEADGKFWAEFLVNDEEAVKKIEKGWTLSVTYNFSPIEKNGHFHGVDYDFEVFDPISDHLAIVQNPRYAESIILTPDEFKEYNDNQMRKISQNEKGVGMLTKIKSRITGKELSVNEKEKKEKELMETKIVLPKTKREVSINDLIAEVDERDWQGMEASLDDFIHIDSVKVTIRELLETIDKLTKADAVEEVIEVASENEEDSEEKEKVDNKEEKEKEVNSENSFFSKMKSAPESKVDIKEERIFVSNQQRIEQGKKTYGRKK